MADRNYVRVYYNDIARDYPDIWYDDAALSSYVRLLAIAEAMWPARPEYPRSARRALAKLHASGLVIALPRQTFAIKGLDAERNARRNAGRNAAASRWADAGRNAEPMPNRAEPNQTDTPPPQVGRRADGTNPRANGTNPRAQGTSPRQERDREKRSPMPEATRDIIRRVVG